MDCSTPGFPVHHQLWELTQVHVQRVRDLIDCLPLPQPSHLLSSPSLQSFPASRSFPMSQFFTSGGQSIGVSASTSVDSSNEHPGLISFRMDWLDLLAVQGTLKSLFQHHSSKASILWRSAFFTVQLSHPYMTTGKAIALTRWTFVSKVMSLLFNICCLGCYTFSSMEQGSFNFMAAITICSHFGAPQNKVWHCFHCFPIYFPWSDGTGCHDLHFLNVEL